MQTAPQIVFEGMDSSEAVRERIEKEIGKLEQFYDRITACRVAVRAPGQHKRNGGLFEVRVYLVLPGGGEIAVGRNPQQDHAHEDVYVAIRDAFAAARRHLQDM